MKANVVVFSLLKKEMRWFIFGFLPKILSSLVVIVVIPVFHHRLLFILQQFKATR